MVEKISLLDHPSLLQEWDYEKNDNLDPRVDRFSQRTELWWICPQHQHSWKRQLSYRLKGANCYYCSGAKVLSGFNDLFTLHPYLEEEWDFERNDDLGIDPREISTGYNKNVFWKCENHSTPYDATPASRVRGRGCKYCANKAVLQGFNDLASQNPVILAEWDYEKNSEIGVDPSQITPGSDKLCHWVCEREQHSYSMKVYKRVSGRGFSVCAGKIVASGSNDFASRFPNLIELWDFDKNDTSPDQVSYGSNVDRYWVGRDCGHSFPRSPKMMRENSDCPYCADSNTTLLKGFNDLATVSPLVAVEWHPAKNGDMKPSDVLNKSSQTVWWQCSKNSSHEWLAKVYNRTGNNSGCPDCWNENHLSQAENELKDYVTSLGFAFVENDRTVLNGKELDIYIPGKILLLSIMDCIGIVRSQARILRITSISGRTVRIKEFIYSLFGKMIG